MCVWAEGGGRGWAVERGEGGGDSIIRLERACYYSEETYCSA